MNKSTANGIARQLYRLAMTRGKFETCQRDYTAEYFPDDDTVVVTYMGPKGDEDVRQHYCKVRKSWMY
jgi:hypothetical protein